MMLRGILLIGLVVLVNSYSSSERKWKFLLPKDVIEELMQLDANSTMDPVGVDRSIDTILRNQSRQDLDQLDLPPYYERLPLFQRWQIQDILFDRYFSYQQKHQMIYDLIHKLAPEQQKFPPLNNVQHSRYFEAFSTLQYQISLTFKLSELKLALPQREMQSILNTLSNHQIKIEDKLSKIDQIMTQQSYDTIDRLFFAGIPIVDPEIKDRFRRLFVAKGFWSMPQQVVQKLTPMHPNCILKPWCNLKYGPKMEEIGQKQIQMDQKQVQMDQKQIQMDQKQDSLPTPPPVSQSQETPQHSIVIEVQSGDSKPIKQEFSVNPLTKMQTIVVESQQIEIDGRMLPKINVFVQKNNDSLESKNDEDGKGDSVEAFQPNVKVAPQLQNPSFNRPWQIPQFIQLNQPNQSPNFNLNENPSTFVGKITNLPNFVITNEKSLTFTGKLPISTEAWKQQVKPPITPTNQFQTNTFPINKNNQDLNRLSNTPNPIPIKESTQIDQTTKQPISQTSSPTRWSITRNGPWTRQDERAFLQKWYKHFGIALTNPGFGQSPVNSVIEKPKEIKLVEIKEEKPIEIPFKALDSVDKPMELNDKKVKVEEVKKPSLVQEKESKDTQPQMDTSNLNQSFRDDSTSSKMSPVGEAHFEALRMAHEKIESKNKEKEAKNEENDEEIGKQNQEKEPKVTESPIEDKNEDKKSFDDQNWRYSPEKSIPSIIPPTIKPPTVVINKEAKEKLVVRHSLKGSTLHLEKLTSAELRETDNSSNTTDETPKNKPESTQTPENDDPNKFLQQPLNDTGSDLLDSLTEGNGSGDKPMKSDGINKTTGIKEEVPSGLLKLRDVLRRLRERIRQSQSLKNSTFTWQNTE